MKTQNSLNLTLSIITTAMIAPANAELLFYEPFDYPDGVLNDQSSGPLGSAGVWVSLDTGFKPAPYEALGTWWVHPEGMTTGQGDDLGGDGLNLFDGTVANIPHRGGFAGPAGPEDKDPPVAAGTRSPTGNLDASIALDPSVTATFQAGTTTWFAYVASHADNRNASSPQFLISTDPILNGDRGYRMQTTNGGFGIGGTGGQTRANLFDVYPQYYSGGVKNQTPGGYQSGILGDHNGRVISVGSTGTSDATLPAAFKMPWVVRDGDGNMGVPNIVVGKIEWDAEDNGEGVLYDVITMVNFTETDELTEAAFDALVALKPELSSRNWPAATTPFDVNNPSNKPDLDQSQFNLISLSGVKFWIDEIRIGTTFEAAIGGEDLADIDLVLSITQNTPTSRFLLSWPTRAGRAYNLRSSADLTGDVSTWTLVEQNIEPSETGTNTLEIDPAEGVLFYRIEEVVPVPEP